MWSGETNKGKEYLITISNRQHKIVKFIDSDSTIKVQKLYFSDEKQPDMHMLILTQLLHIKQYIMRRR
jgi:hypothetical protein